ncbi:MAG: hypothetical protein GY864_02055 [Desulfobacterales bacterium]|nr:hypothetical protein [Desulfobacterales bacterium]
MHNILLEDLHVESNFSGTTPDIGVDELKVDSEGIKRSKNGKMDGWFS